MSRFDVQAMSLFELGTTRLHTSLQEQQPDSVARAVVFICANWSAPARHALQVLSNEINAAYADRPELDLFVLDTDDPLVPPWAIARGILPQGYGETFWMRTGKVIYRMSKYTTSDRNQIVQFTESILA
jgi:hypothetical protein